VMLQTDRWGSACSHAAWQTRYELACVATAALGNLL
jgi:hypothetical protein